MTWKFPKKPFEKLFSDAEWAEQCKCYGFRPYERTFIDELIAFYRLNKPQKSAIPPVPPARTKNALRKMREQTLKSWTSLKSKTNAMSEQQAADIDSAVSKLIRECERIEGAMPNRRPGRDAEIPKVTICLLHMFMILQTGKRIKRSYKATSTQDFAVWFCRFADPGLKESTTVYAIKEYLRGYGEDEARYLLGDDEEFNRTYKEKIQRILQIGQNLTDSRSF